MENTVVKNIFTKEISQKLYGAAILLMVFHHLFYSSDILGNSISIIPRSVEEQIGWFGKICIGIYTFVTGYGMKLSFRRTENSIHSNYRVVLKHLISFYYKYWLVFFSIIPVGFIIGFFEFDIIDFLLNLFGLKISFVGTWWYISTYIWFILLLPLLTFLFKNGNSILLDVIKSLCLLFFIWFFIEYISPQNFYEYLKTIFTVYFVILIEGILVAKHNLFNKILNRINISKKTKILLSFILISSVFFVRYTWANSATWNKGDFLLVPLLIFSLILLYNEVREENLFMKVLSVVGQYSFYIWLVHPILRYNPFLKLITLPRFSILIYLWVLFLSYIAAIIYCKLLEFTMKWAIKSFKR